MSILQTADMAAANAILKELYDGQTPEDLTYQDRPLFAMLSKMEDYGGEGYPLPVTFGKGQGRSASFTNAQSNQSASSRVKFFLTDVNDYALATLARKAVLQAAGNRQSFINYATGEIDGAFDTAAASASSGIFRNGTGSIGVIGTISSGVITFSDPDMVTQFERNMVIEACATDGGTARAAVGYVVGRNAQAGQITVSTSFQGAAGTPGSWAAGDFLTVQGDRNAKVKGLAAWIPATAPTSGDNFFGVDRSVDSRLYGMYMDLSDRSPEEALVKATTYLGREGANTDLIVVPPTSMGAMISSLGSKVQYVTLQGPGKIGFQGIQVQCGKRIVNVLADKDCQAQTAWLLQMNTWKLYSTGSVPHLQQDNGKFLTVATSDAYEVRVSSYLQLGCRAPGWNGQVKLSV